MNYLEKGLHFGNNESQILLEGIILNKARALPNIEIPWHFHENAYFLYNMDGHLQEVSKKRTADLHPGSVLFHNVEEPHYNKNILNTVNFLHVELTPQWFDKYAIQPDIIKGDFSLESPSLKTIFEKLCIETTLMDAATAISIESLVLQAFSHIIRDGKNKQSKKPDWVSKINVIIEDENWENLSLNSISNELGLHPAYLSRKFPEHFKVNLGDYIRERKIQKAITLLKSKSFTIMDIAYQCGFADESHFNKTFKSKFGITPSQYKKQF